MAYIGQEARRSYSYNARCQPGHIWFSWCGFWCYRYFRSRLWHLDQLIGRIGFFHRRHSPEVCLPKHVNTFVLRIWQLVSRTDIFLRITFYASHCLKMITWKVENSKGRYSYSCEFMDHKIKDLAEDAGCMWGVKKRRFWHSIRDS